MLSRVSLCSRVCVSSCCYVLVYYVLPRCYVLVTKLKNRYIMNVILILRLKLRWYNVQPTSEISPKTSSKRQKKIENPN